MDKIELVPVEWLEHHPDNPRKDLGDLTELADSIRANGILQNLTIVAAPADEDCPAQYRTFYVVIGNRRMEAAKLAGLKELPCVLSDMDHKTQVATMLQENMQRSDLTVYEQAEGFQLMMDLGFKPKEISEKTGFSEKTVKDRLKLTKLNKKNFTEAVNHGATLLDMIEITKLESKTAQNEVMKAAGTDNFRQKMKEALQLQETRHNQERVTPILTEAGFEEMPEKERWSNNDWETLYGHYLDIKDDEDKFRKALKKFLKDRPGPFRYFFTKWGGIEIYQKKSKAPKNLMTAEEKTECQKAIARGKHLRYVKSFWEQAFELRKDFLKDYTIANGQSATMLGKILVRYALTASHYYGGKLGDNHTWSDQYMREVMGLPEEPVELPNQEDVNSWNKKYETLWETAEKKGVPVVRIMLAWAVGGGCFWPDNPENGCYDGYDGHYEKHSNRSSCINELYDFLVEIGYRLSDMEKQLLDGTHECYQPEAGL